MYQRPHVVCLESAEWNGLAWPGQCAADQKGVFISSACDWESIFANAKVAEGHETICEPSNINSHVEFANRIRDLPRSGGIRQLD